MNATHGSDSRASASREIRFHFPKLTQVCPGRSACTLHKRNTAHCTACDTCGHGHADGSYEDRCPEEAGHQDLEAAYVTAAVKQAAAAAVQLRAWRSCWRDFCSPEMSVNDVPACSRFKFVLAGPSAGRSSCLTGG